MMNDRPGSGQPSVEPGLCGRCAQAREVVSARGRRFLLCARSRIDPAYPRYPRLPVTACAGFDPAPLPASDPANSD